MLGERGIETLHTTQFKRQINEGIFMIHNGGADQVKIAAQLLGPDFRVFLHEGAEQPDHGKAMQRFIAHRPAHDLAHALHLVEAREIHENREGSEKLQAFGEGTKGGQRLRDFGFVRNAEALHVIVLVLHLLVFEEGRVFDFRHADGIEQMAIGRDMHRFDVREGREHHQHFRRLEHLGIMLHVAIIHFHIRLGEEAENLRQQIAFGLREVLLPILHIIRERHFFRQPMDALLLQPGFIGPGVAEGLIDRVRRQKIEFHRQFIPHHAIGHCVESHLVWLPRLLPQLVGRAIVNRKILWLPYSTRIFASRATTIFSANSRAIRAENTSGPSPRITPPWSIRRWRMVGSRSRP